MTRTSRGLDWRAIGFGAGVSLVVGVPVSLLSQALDATDRIDDDSGAVYVAAAVIIVGLGIGGAFAAARRPDAPMRHGALAALVGFAVVTTIGLVRRAVDDEALRWGIVAINAVVAAWAGIVGALVSEMWASRRRERRSTS